MGPFLLAIINNYGLCIGRHSPTDVYVVFELMDTDLSRVIESSQHLGDEHIKFFMYQLLSAVHFLHTAGIAHRDIKPRNMLVNADCTLKICDFGLARLCTPDLVVDGGMTDYVATRWYRAPEVFGSGSRRPLALDMWAAGCVLGELRLRRPLFPGKNAIHTLELIFAVVGYPSDTVLRRLLPGSGNLDMRAYFRTACHDNNPNTSSFVGLGKGASTEFMALLKGLCAIDPRTRFNSWRAIEDPYICAHVGSELNNIRRGNAIDPRAFACFTLLCPFLCTPNFRKPNFCI